MTTAQLLQMLTERAREFRKDHDHYKRNSHLHDVKASPSQAAIDAVLVGFINDVAYHYGIDYALHTFDLEQNES